MFRNFAMAAAFFSFSGIASASNDIDLELDLDITVETDDAVVIDSPEASDSEEEETEPRREILEVDEDMVIGADFLGLPATQASPKTGLEEAVEFAAVPTAESAQQLKWNFAMDEDGDLDLSAAPEEEEEVLEVEESTENALPEQDALLQIIDE